MQKCVCCESRIWFFQKTGANSSWHLKCWNAWEKGYNVAHEFAKNENAIHNIEDPWVLYSLRMKNSGLYGPLEIIGKEGSL